MKHFLPLFSILILLGCTPSSKNKNVFKLHLFVEPQQLDPAKGRSSSANYFFHNILRGLYTYSNKEGLTPENGQCQWKSKLQLHCTLSKEFQWSDGSPVIAEDYARAFTHLVTPATAAPRASLLINVKNAESILSGKKAPEELGLNITGRYSFDVLFDRPDPEFIYKLTSTALLPKHSNNPKSKKQYKHFHSNGPYKIKSWKNGQWIVLTKNEFYPRGNPLRPDVQLFIIDSDLTAFRLYERGQLDFLRRALPRFVQKLKGRKDFYQIPQARFDYIGFGAPLKDNLYLRKALALSIDYQASIKVLEALGPLGCPSIPAAWMDKQPCYPFDIRQAKEALAKVSPALLKQKMIYAFSMLGGPVLKKQAEFLQNQWKKNLGLNIELRMVEQKMYLKNLRAEPFSIFRKGIGLDRPSCTAALETFKSGNPNNYIMWKNSKYEDRVWQTSLVEDSSQKKKSCRKAIEILMNEYRIIPMGEMHFTILARPQFSGWKLNQLNQLDLSQLQLSQP